jgi:hypothetical protein
VHVVVLCVRVVVVSGTGSINLWRMPDALVTDDARPLHAPSIVAQLVGVDCEPVHDLWLHPSGTDVSAVSPNATLAPPTAAASASAAAPTFTTTSATAPSISAYVASYGAVRVYSLSLLSSSTSVASAADEWHHLRVPQRRTGMA